MHTTKLDKENKVVDMCRKLEMVTGRKCIDSILQISQVTHRNVSAIVKYKWMYCTEFILSCYLSLSIPATEDVKPYQPIVVFI